MPDLLATPDGHRLFRVSDLMGGVRELLEEEIGRVFVVGEISNLHRAGSGHCYFTLKDDAGQIRAALFRGTAVRIPFDPEEGMEVVVAADVTVYAPRGDLQLIVRHLEPRGQGALQLAFEQLRGRLEAEGLFAAELKRPIPDWPRRIGVVTSPTGAAVRDVIQVTGHRMPRVPLLVAPTRVQGQGAELEVAAALAAVARAPDVDVVLLVRGGGSLEDLQAFNSEPVARAIRTCPVPVICGVGHEVDLTIADLAADLRAPTPSAAAALVLPDRAALAEELRGVTRRLAAATRANLHRQAQGLAGLEAALRAHAPAARLAARRERLDALAHALARSAEGLAAPRRARLVGAQRALLRAARQQAPVRRARLERARERLTGAASAGPERARGRLVAAMGRLDALSPLAVLGRGYAIAFGPDGRALHRAQEVTPGAALRIRLAEGELDTEVTAVRPTGAGDPDST